jgi:hypothetical protein
MNALRQLLYKLSNSESLNGDDVVALILVVTMVTSTAHLLTMLVTRWGDRHIALKSLAASVLIHGVCFLGLEVFDPIEAAKLFAEEQAERVQKQEFELLVESDQSFNAAESGNTPLADLPSQPEIELFRFPDTAPDLATPELPERSPDQFESLNTAVSDVAQFEESPIPQMARPEDAGIEGPKQAAAEDPAADLKSVFEQNDADVPEIEKSRTRPNPGSETDVARPDVRDAPALSAQQFEPESNPLDVTMSVPTDESATPDIRPADEVTQDQIDRQSAPLIAAIPSELGGTGTEVNVPRPSESASFQPRLPRQSRGAPDEIPADRPSRPSFQVARTPTPLSTDYEDVRIGGMAPATSTDLTTASPIVEDALPTIRRRDNPPANYQLRDIEQRREAARKFGGTRESEQAVERSLKWLTSVQAADGRWDASDHGAGQVKTDENGVDRNFAGREADTGVTALVILSFLGAGYTHETMDGEQGKYAIVVDRALDWLIRQQTSDGCLSGKAEHFARMYCHAMATYALAEAYGMQKETVLGPMIDPLTLSEPQELAVLIGSTYGGGFFGPPAALTAVQSPFLRMVADDLAFGLRRVDDLRLRNALVRAITYTMGQQDVKSGGWRYKFGQEGDVSMFGWQLMSLKSAEIAGVRIHPLVRQRMDAFLASVRQGEKGGLFGYRRNIPNRDGDTEPVTPVMTAEALFCQQMLGYPRDSDSSRESVAYLMQNPPRLADLNFYYWYYGTLSMYQYGGRPWETWNVVVRDTLVEQQVTQGPMAGSWEPNDPWGRYGGRLYSTALATLTLEVYYRLLPLYRMNDVKPTNDVRPTP